MDTDVLDFITGQRVGVVALAMPDGSVHGATVHFACTTDPLRFIFYTSPTSKKALAFQAEEAAASFVIGTNEATMKTMQIDGVAKVVSDDNLQTIYFEKFPEKTDRFPDNILVVLTPTWWRFTDMKHPDGRKVIENDNGQDKL